MLNKNMRINFTAHRQVIGSAGLLAIIVLALLFWRLGTTVPGYSPSELAVYHQSSSLHTLLTNPTDLPYTGLVHLAIRLHPHSFLVVRIVSAVLGAVMAGIFYWLMQHWHGQRIAWMATILFATSTRFLHTTRLGTPQILLLGLFALMAYGVWLKERLRPRFALPVGLFLACLLLYVPGMLWFIVDGIIWQRHTIIDKIWKTPAWLTTLSALPALAILFPLGWSIAKHPKLAESFAGIPSPFPHITQILHNLASVPLQIFYTHSTLTSDLGTPGLLTLDAFAIVMFVFGAYLYGKHFKLGRASFLVGIFGISCVLIGFGTMSVTILFPFIYMVVAAGVGYLLGQWLAVFPRNIFARSTGIVLLSAVIALCCVYNLRRYFVAWPTSANTRAIFSHRPS